MAQVHILDVHAAIESLGEAKGEAVAKMMGFSQPKWWVLTSKMNNMLFLE